MKEHKEIATILIVDDSFTNRMLLNKAFSSDYHVELAENGAQAVAMLEHLENVAAVVLDIQMPEMDGYEVLDIMRNDARLKEIPVVVDTSSDDVDSQLKALDYGAMDVLIKPFNPKIALHRVRNIINRREADRQLARNNMLEELLRQSEVDEKTGIYNKHAFCRMTADMLKENPDKQYVILRWDIDRFKVFNDAFGVAEGDKFLAGIGEAYKEYTRPGMTYGHWEADHFVFCVEYSIFKDYKIADKLNSLVCSLHMDFDFAIRVGVYVVDDPTLDVALMCDRALLALRSIKYNYSEHVAYYDDSMRATLLEEQEIQGEMERALENGQFLVYLQPQYDYSSASLYGAEALIRWKHPEKGLISPGRFIPVFEQNGFISKVDEYVWEKVCELQRNWIDAGIPVVPISVNVSRRDIYNPHLCEVLENLIHKYDLSPSLLHLEITESAYMESAKQLISTINHLKDVGFSIYMDDFGSGYSSLNTLKDVPVDTLKLDMQFLENCMDNARGGSILTSIIRMAHWIQLPVIAEGVETKAQADYLKSVGCNFMQGYLFARPMPVDEYEQVLRDNSSNQATNRYFQDDIQGAENFLSASTQATLLFNSFVGGAAIVEYDGYNVEALRLNDKYFEVLGITRDDYAGKQIHLQERLTNEYRRLFLSKIREAIDTGKESTCQLCSKPLRENGDPIWLRVRMRLLAQNGSRYIFYMTMENISEQMQLLTKNTQLSEQLSGIIDTLPGGIFDYIITDKLRISYFNDMAASMFGYTRSEYKELFEESPLATVHPEDTEDVNRQLLQLRDGTIPTLELVYRHVCHNGSFRYVRLTVRILRSNKQTIFARGILLDIDREVRNSKIAKKQAKELERQRVSLQSLYDTIPCGIMQLAPSFDEKGMVRLLSFNDTVWRIYGYESRQQYVESIRGRSRLKDVHPEDLPHMRQCINNLYDGEAGRSMDIEHRIIRPDGSIRWVHALFQKVRYNNKEEVVQVVFSDITERKQENLEQLINALFGLYDEIYEFDMEKNTCYMRSARQLGDSRVGRVVPFDHHLNVLCKQYVIREDRKKVRDFYLDTMHRSHKMSHTVEFRYHNSKKELRWASVTIVYLGGASYLTCNNDITDQKNVISLAKENEELQEKIRLQLKEDERNRIFMESTGMLVYDYDPATDTNKVQHLDHRNGLVEEIIPDFMADLMDNTTVRAENRERLLNTFQEALKEPVHRTIEYRGNHFDDTYALCRNQMASIADTSGNVYRIIGQVSLVQEDNKPAIAANITNQENSSLLPELTVDILQKLEHNSAYVYIVDPDTCEIQYWNEAVAGIKTKPIKGDRCYEIFAGCKTMCSDCPMKELSHYGISIPTTVLDNGRCLVVQAANLRWNGKMVTMISGTDQHSFVGDSVKNHKLEYEESLNRYVRTLHILYDEIFELNYASDTFRSIYSSFCKRNNSKLPLRDTVTRWGSEFLMEEDKNTIDQILNIKEIRRLFQKGEETSLEYRIRLKDNSIRYCQGTLLQLDASRYLYCIKDVTKQREAEQAQQEMAMMKSKSEIEDRYRIVVEQTGTAVYEMNYETGKFFSTVACEKYEVSKRKHEKLLGYRFSKELVHPHDQELFDEFMKKTETRAPYVDVVLRLKMVDGSYRWTRVAGTFIRDAKGKSLRTIGTFTDVDEEMRSKRALERLSDRMQRIITNIPTGVAIFEVAEKVYPVFISDKTCEMFGYTREEYDLRIANGEPVNFMPDMSQFPDYNLDSMLDGQPIVLQRLHVKKKDGTWFWVRIFCSMSKGPEGEVLCYAVLADITKELEMEEQYNWQAEKYRILIESEDMITFEYSPEDDVMHLSMYLPGKGFTERIHKDYVATFAGSHYIPENQKETYIETLTNAAQSKGSGTFDFEADIYGAGMRWYRAKYVSITTKEGQVHHIIGRLNDINDIVREKDQLRVDAQIDELTGIYNKNYAISAIQQALQEKPASQLDAVFFLDIDKFKRINDTYGHMEADKVLQQMGALLKGLFRGTDIVARFGGDEFIIYMRAIDSINIATSKAERILKAVAEIIIGGEKPVQCSIGITPIDGEGITYEGALKRADMALYEAKENGRAQYMVLERRYRKQKKTGKESEE